MSEGGPCQTPLIDLLRCIPEDAVYQWEDEVRGFRSWSSSPIGKHCHRAADEIEQLLEKLPCGHRKIDMDDSYGGCVFCQYRDGYEEYEEEIERLLTDSDYYSQQRREHNRPDTTKCDDDMCKPCFDNEMRELAETTKNGEPCQECGEPMPHELSECKLPEKVSEPNSKA